MKPWQWEFVFPPEHIKNADEPRRILWRRLIAAYTLKFGTFGSPEYKAVIDEMLDPSNCPPVTLRTLYNRTEDGYVRVEPAGVGLEDFMWPLMFVCAAAQNREELGAQLNAAYAGLVQSEKIGYENTDIPRN
jgi:hypothetical protein